MQYYNLKTSQRFSLILFISGGLLSVILDLLGIGSVTPQAVFNTPVNIPVPDFIAVPAVFAAAGIIVGLVSKTQAAAVIYGIAAGQCQFFLPLIVYLFILHSGTPFDVMWRSLCGLPLTTAFSGIAFSIKTLVGNSNKKK